MTVAFEARMYTRLLFEKTPNIPGYYSLFSKSNSRQF